MQARRGKGILFVISAPSGTGKSTLARRLLQEDAALSFSVSHTTRPRRQGEQDGREYHFVEDARFDRMVADGEFLEWAEVFGRRYGTGREDTERMLEHGKDVILDIDVQGAGQIRESGVGAVCVFVLPPDYPTLERRLASRQTETEADRSFRLAVARREATEFSSYDYLVVNDDLERAVEDLASIVRAERLRVARRTAEARRIVQTFPPA